MPILPPDRGSFGGESDARDGRGRRRVGGRGGGSDEAPDTREVTCTTCLQHFPSNETLMTERGPTCGPCQAQMEAPDARRSGQALLVFGLVLAGLVVVGLVVAVVQLVG